MARRDASQELLPMEVLEQAAECLRAIAHPHRLRMLELLLKGRYTVGELAEACEIPSNVASEHLRLLQRCGVLEREREGRRTYYRVAKRQIGRLLQCVASWAEER